MGYWTLRFPAEENPNTGKGTVRLAKIVLQYDI